MFIGLFKKNGNLCKNSKFLGGNIMVIKLVKKNLVETRDFGNGLTLQILLDKIEGAKNLDLGTVSIPPKSETPMHVRTFEEVIYMLSGEGQVKTEDGKVYILKTGDCILIPEGLVHCHANDTDIELEQLYIFAPQAPSNIQESLRNLSVLN
jgi:quercetin dioxygenase-like cupin family protein